jgi:hypothetical protein
VSRRKSDPLEGRSRRPPATNPQDRENQIIAAAFDLAEKQIRDGTASSQVLSLFLKYGSSREKLEQEKIAMENNLLETKREILESEKRTEELYRKALDAMRTYSGQAPEIQGVEYDDFED